MTSLRLFVHDMKGNPKMYAASEAGTNVYLHRGFIPYGDIVGKSLTPVKFLQDCHVTSFGMTKKVTSIMYSKSSNTTYIYTS